MVGSSVVVLIVDQFDIPADKTEGHAPVAIDPYRMEAGQTAFQRMQSQGGRIQFGGFGGRLQCGEDEAELARVSRLYATRAARGMKVHQSLVSKAFYHSKCTV